MALADIYSNLLIWIRWFHVLAAMLWIGPLFFCDFLILPSQADPIVLHRAVSWLKWLATLALASGLLLLLLAYFYSPQSGFGPTPLLISEQAVTDRAAWVLLGMLLAMLMWFQVWFVMFPMQSRLLRGDARPDEVPILRVRLGRASRAATLLSGPTLFAMLAPAHYGSINWITVWVVLVGGIALIGCAAALVARWKPRG